MRHEKELCYMLCQLRSHKLTGCAPGGVQVSLQPDVGIKQGAPESQELFAMILDSVLSDLVAHQQWGDMGSAFDELDLDMLLYQDDIFLLDCDLARLCRRIRIIDRCLARVGLQLSTDKTKIVANDFYRGVRKVKIGEDVFEIAKKGETLKVLGLDFSLSNDQSEQAREITARVRSAAAFHSDILQAPGPWQGKVSIMRTLLESQFNWIGGALHCGQAELQAFNTLQLQTCRAAFGLKRYRGETWVDWNKRSLRLVRLWLHTNNWPRWSTRVLSLQHMLHGHWARRTEVVKGVPHACPPMKALQWRCTHWWRGQQALSPSVSLRHPGRFYASNTERQLADGHGNLWFVTAQDRHQWSLERDRYLRDWDVRWSSGRQLSLRC